MQLNVSATPARKNLNDLAGDVGEAASVLVVDDQAMNRHLLCRLLESHGFRTVEAESGLEAIRKLDEEKVDLVLLDIVMPEMDGFDVLSRVRGRASESDLPVIMVTSTSESEQIVRAFQCGANDFVTKPIDIGVTMARISTHVKLRQSQAALRQSEERYSLAARGTNDGLWDWDLKTDQVYYSPRWLTMLGIEDEEGGCEPFIWLSRIHADDRTGVDEALQSHLKGETPQFETELRMRHSNGNYRWMLCRGLAVRDDEGQPLRLAGSLTDITEGKVADALTGLPNRVLLLERLRKIADRRRDGNEFGFALIYLDLDNFKLINDSLGHDVGDRLLVSVARRLEESVSAADAFVSRLGGDEFAILVDGIRSDEDVRVVAELILDSMSAPFVLGAGKEVFASTSLGVSVSTKSGHDCTDMLQEADTAMYQAKAQGKSCFQIFNPRMKERVTRRLEIENELRRAIDGREFHVQYQPIVALPTGNLVGFEALARWNNPRMGNVGPGEFIPVAEDTGLIVPIGRSVLREACRQMAEWKKSDSRFRDTVISVNLSCRQLSHPELLSDIFSTLQDTGLTAGDLKLEVTESAIMQNPDAGATLLGRLRDFGVKVAIDDFGTGYSSLACLHSLPLDSLKIDRSFINKMTRSDDNSAIVRTIVALANLMNLAVIAEGIETPEQREMLEEMGCEFAQGFYFSPPLSPQQVKKTAWQIGRQFAPGGVSTEIQQAV